MKLWILPLFDSYVIRKEIASITAKIAANRSRGPEFGTKNVDSYPKSLACSLYGSSFSI